MGVHDGLANRPPTHRIWSLRRVETAVPARFELGHARYRPPGFQSDRLVAWLRSGHGQDTNARVAHRFHRVAGQIEPHQLYLHLLHKREPGVARHPKVQCDQAAGLDPGKRANFLDRRFQIFDSFCSEIFSIAGRCAGGLTMGNNRQTPRIRWAIAVSDWFTPCAGAKAIWPNSLRRKTWMNSDCNSASRRSWRWRSVRARTKPANNCVPAWHPWACAPSGVPASALFAARHLCRERSWRCPRSRYRFSVIGHPDFQLRAADNLQ